MTATVRLLSVAEIEATYGVDRQTLWHRAHRRKWDRIKWRGRVYYRLEDVDKEFGKD